LIRLIFLELFSEFAVGSDQIPIELPFLDDETTTLDSEINDLKNELVEIVVTETEDDFFEIKGGPVYLRCSKEGITVLIYLKSREVYEAGLRNSRGLGFDLMEGSNARNGVNRVRVLSGGEEDLQKRVDEFLEAANVMQKGFVKVRSCVGVIWPQ
jgi:hypothetical protein